MGTPAGSSQAGSALGHCVVAHVNRALGCAAGVSESGAQALPFQSVKFAGGSIPMPSHQTSPSSVKATLVNMVSRSIIFIALGFELKEVPGTTPK